MAVGGGTGCAWQQRAHRPILGVVDEMTKTGADADGAEGAAAGDPQVALVTGANKGIGLHIARQLAQRGLLLLVGSRDAERGRAAVAELVGEGLDVRLLVLDVTALPEAEDDPAQRARRARVRRAHRPVSVGVARQRRG